MGRSAALGATPEHLGEMRAVIMEHCPGFAGIGRWFSLWDKQQIPNKVAYYQHLAYVIQFNNLGNHLPSDSLRERLNFGQM